MHLQERKQAAQEEGRLLELERSARADERDASIDRLKTKLADVSAKAYGHDAALQHELSTLRRQLQSREDEAGKLRWEVETLRTVVEGLSLLGEHLDNAETPASQMESTWAKLSEASALMDSAGLRNVGKNR